MYSKCAEVFVYSENMKQQIIAFGAVAEKIKVIRYGAVSPNLVPAESWCNTSISAATTSREARDMLEILDALAILKSKGR